MSAAGGGLRAIVTGASRGIGRATCRQLAEASPSWRGAPARILAVDIAADELVTLAAELDGSGTDLVPFEGDVTDPDMPARAVEAARRRFGGLDALVNNAGFARHAPLTELSLDQWDMVFAANVRAPWLLAKTAYPLLREAKGAIVIVCSISGVNPQVGLGAYSASKAAAIMLMRHLAVEWGGSGIRVNGVSPGATHTATTDRYYRHPAIRAQREAKIPLGRLGEPADIADAIVFLLGPDASYCHGTNLVVDGGMGRAAMDHFAKVPRSPAPAGAL